MKSGALGAGGSVHTMHVSATITMCPLATEVAQNIFDTDWLGLAAYISPNVTAPCMWGEPLHGAYAFRVPLSFRTYVHMSRR